MTASPFVRAGKLEDRATTLKAEQVQHANTKAALSSQAAAAARLLEDIRERYEANQLCSAMHHLAITVAALAQQYAAEAAAVCHTG